MWSSLAWETASSYTKTQAAWPSPVLTGRGAAGKMAPGRRSTSQGWPLTGERGRWQKTLKKHSIFCSIKHWFNFSELGKKPLEMAFGHKGQIFLGVRRTLSGHVQKVSFQFTNHLTVKLVFPALGLRVPSKSSWRDLTRDKQYVI